VARPEATHVAPHRLGGDEQQVSLPVGRRHLAGRPARVGRAGPLAGIGDDRLRHLAAEQLVARAVHHVEQRHALPRPVGEPRPQRRHAAVAEHRGGGRHRHRRPRPAGQGRVALGLDAAALALLVPPHRAADRRAGQDQRQPEGEEEFPEQPPEPHRRRPHSRTIR
jgi:hypothetical protein